MKSRNYNGKNALSVARGWHWSQHCCLHSNSSPPVLRSLHHTGHCHSRWLRQERLYHRSKCQKESRSTNDCLARLPVVVEQRCYIILVLLSTLLFSYSAIITNRLLVYCILVVVHSFAFCWTAQMKKTIAELAQLSGGRAARRPHAHHLPDYRRLVLAHHSHEGRRQEWIHRCSMSSL